ncbi:nucleoside recognition protein [Hwanghaeella grinnelliae]|uniref:Nucleoside recognition protein n=1 Tax=Hwanghaeella grinnelliae TaxID=2500179 RepID=A0A437QNP3_9PROT|nr:nucleoside recognition domain-containing protein [Hwanghaeella grinnelliae]RVU36178.1 nucleoside recognition protein [Hwanghaeella grinnelliae]
MRFVADLGRGLRDIFGIYWELVRIIVPVAVGTELLSRLGAIEMVSPMLAPVMDLFGLPPELGLAWLTGLLVGIWGAISLIFALVPVSELTTADVTVFSALLLFAHALPIEQKIIQKAGPGMALTISLRVGGGIIYAFLLHRVLTAAEWLSDPVNPTWIPLNVTTDWIDFFAGLIEALAVMFLVLAGLTWGLALMKRVGLLRGLMWLLSPAMRLAGIRREAEQFAAVGLFLGISYGGGLLIREARSGRVPPRDTFIACVFMGFAHSVIEDTIVVMALGADITSILVGRIAFAIVATALIAALVRSLADDTFFTWMFRRAEQPG